MSVEFKDTNPFKQMPKPQSPSIGGWLIKKGFAKDQKGADQLMIIISIVCFAVAIYFAIK
ncbi:MAG: hypothetical protein WCO10_00465 [bacterium]